ncbi:hypothetical protein [Leucobacter albus]|uniref:Uncharacterized protein n=1 Tax=Leucobacter albus TaxID=272210 RepID=A0ABW3TSB5_9MICO
MVAAVVLVALLAGCAALLPDTHEKAVPERVAAADIGASRVQAGTYWEGFSKGLSVDLYFETSGITPDQVTRSLVAVSEGLGLNSGAKLTVAFFSEGPDQLGGVAETLQSLNRQLGRSGEDAVDDDNAIIIFSSGKELQEFVSDLRDAGLL